jgi:LysR family transcriptional activator of glutamate synthase operon
MDIRQLRSFAAVARLQHFTRAAEELHLAQPALSQQIQQMERDLGVRLFDRSSRHVRLTEAGSALYVHAQRILADIDRAENAMAAYAGLQRGRVAIGTLQTVAEGTLPPLIARFHHEYPGLEVRLIEETTEQLVGMVADGRLDVAFIHVGRYDAESEATFPPIPQGEITSTPLYSEELVLAVAPEHRLAGSGGVTFAALRNEPLVVFKSGASLRHLVTAACAYHGFAPRISFEVSGAASARALAAKGLGLAVLPRSAVVEQGPRVVAVPLLGLGLARTVLLARHSRRELSPAAAAFLATVFAAYPQAPAGDAKA